MNTIKHFIRDPNNIIPDFKKINAPKHFMLNSNNIIPDFKMKRAIPIGLIGIAMFVILFSRPDWPNWSYTPTKEFIAFLQELTVPPNLADYLYDTDRVKLSLQQREQLYLECISIKTKIPLGIVKNYFYWIHYTNISKVQYLRLFLICAFQEDGVDTLREIMHYKLPEVDLARTVQVPKFLIREEQVMWYENMSTTISEWVRHNIMPLHRKVEKTLVASYKKWFKD